eukprot:10391964-Alexandrium_andersonii.AAC.1
MAGPSETACLMASPSDPCIPASMPYCETCGPLASRVSEFRQRARPGLWGRALRMANNQVRWQSQAPALV